MRLAHKPNHAVVVNGGQTKRSVWGYFKPQDAEVIGREYSMVGAGMVQRIAAQINDPRLLEVLGIVEVVHRYLEGKFSNLRKGAEGVRLVANPLSILFWNAEQRRVQRVVAPETELLHKPMEKLSLRISNLLGINQLLDQEYGVQLAFGCSCCVLVSSADDMPAVLDSEYYMKREQLGRRYDSDVLAATGDLFEVDSVADIPEGILDQSADFHAEEVESFLRYARVAQLVIDSDTGNEVNIYDLDPRAACFLGGECACPLN